LNHSREIDFDPASDIVFLMKEALPYHPNALTFLVEFSNGEKHTSTYYSVGGGFVEQEGEEKLNKSHVQLPFPINNASDLLHWCIKTGFSIHEVVMENENTWRSEEATSSGLLNIYRVMWECIYKGCRHEGI